MPKFILILLAVVSTTFAATNGPCTGRSGICIDSGTCSTLGGTVYSGKCPSDPNSIKCCDNIPCRSDDGKLVQEVLLMEVHLKINSLDHAQAVVELVLILKLFLAKRVLFLVNVQEEVMLNVALLDLDLHGI